jgi:hypothetical protein
MPRDSPVAQRNRDAKSDRLITTGRCHTLASIPGKVWTGVIEGDSGRYLVTSVDGDAITDLRLGTGAVPPREHCGCHAFTHTSRCAHALAAWKLRIRSTPVDELFNRLGA